jgi:hypothetical protein
MTDWHPAIASIVANHEMEKADFYYDQTVRATAVLQQIIRALDLPPDHSPTGVAGDVLIMGSWWASRIIGAIRERAA